MLEILLFLYLILILFILNRLYKVINIKYFTINGFYLLFFFAACSALLLPYVNELKNRPGYENMLLAIFLHFSFYALGIIAFNCFFSFNYKSSFSSYISDEFYTNSLEKRILKILLVVSVILSVTQIITLKTIPILMIFQSSNNVDYAELAITRSETFDGGVLGYIFHLNRQLLIPLVTIGYFLIFFFSKTIKTFLIFFIVLIFAIVNNSLSSALAPVATLFLLIFFSYLYISPKLNIRNVILLFLAILSFPFLVEYISSDNLSLFNSISHTADKVAYRYTGETLDRTLCYFDYYGIESDFLGGRTNKLFTIFSGEELFKVQNFMFVKHLPKEKLFYASHGNMNANFIAYMYSDFSFIGVIISSFLMGFITSLFQNFYIQKEKTILNFSAYIVTIGLFWKLSGTQPTTILFSHGAVFLFIFIYYLSKRHKSFKLEPL